MPRRCPSRAGLGFAVLLLAYTPAPLAAQRGAATLVGELVDRTTRAPLSGARVALIGGAAVLYADVTGHFTRAGLRPGAYLLQARALGYVPTDLAIELVAGETRQVVLEMEQLAIEVRGLVVTGAAPHPDRRLAEFEQRRQSGRGYFLSEADILTRGAKKLSELLRSVPGVRIICRGGFCRVRMDRAPRGCAPDFVVDGFPATNSTSADMNLVGVVGIEVYRTVGETPMQFLGGDNTCGTIVIWTKSGR